MKKAKNKIKKEKNKTTKTQQKKQEKINLDNEIIIGLTPKKEPSKNSKGNKKTKNIKKTKKSKKNVQKNHKEKTNKKQKSSFKFIKWTSLFIFLILAIILFIKSPIFNIKEIKVINNNKISSEEIIKLSTLELGNNMFKYQNRTIKNGIKTNAYIENVKVKRAINGIVTLEIEERKPTYMLKFANAYVYINNQGYMLEMTQTPIEVPMIIGFETPTEEIKEGNRLCIKDLEKLEDVIKIMNSAGETALSNKITSVDITNKNNYKLIIDSENKTVQFGDTTNINVKLLKIYEILEKEKGVSGEIYFQDAERTIFKENV